MVTIADMREYLELKATDKDIWVKELITASTLLIKYYTGADLTVETATANTFDGTGEIFLPITSPLAAVTEVTFDDVVQTLVDFRVNGYFLENNEGTIFPEGTQNVVVTGDWGTADTDWDSDLDVAQRMLIAWLYKKDKNEISVETRSYKGQYTSMIQDIQLTIRIILDNHKTRVLKWLEVYLNGVIIFLISEILKIFEH